MSTHEETNGESLQDASGLMSGNGSEEQQTDITTTTPATEDEREKASSVCQKTLRLAEKTLRDRSCYRGHVTDASRPCGHGVVYTALGTHTYAGTVASHDHDECIARRLGVQLLPHGTLFAGDFQREDPHGDGVKRDSFGNQYMGQWHDGELDGPGLSISVDGDACWGEFRQNDLADGGIPTTTDWAVIQPTVLRALLAERHALQAQEQARDAELCVLLEGLSSVGDKPFYSADALNQFTAEEDAKLRSFLDETTQQLYGVEQDADRGKFEEAQLKEKQKNLRREITETRAALASAAKYVALAETRTTQLANAERTLQSLQSQIQSLEVPPTTESMESSDGTHVEVDTLVVRFF